MKTASFQSPQNKSQITSCFEHDFAIYCAYDH